MTLEAIIERIMTMHWDMKACNCWVCEAARENRCSPRGQYLDWRGKYGYVDVKAIEK